MEHHGDYVDFQTKYILVVGGGVNGIGKTSVVGGIGTLLRACDLNVTAIKVCPYFNVDASNFDLYTHGEVFILEDGGMVDMDIGIFERFLDINIPSLNYITGGKIFGHILNKERSSKYNGETVELTTHFAREIHEWVKKVSSQTIPPGNKCPEVCIIELGGLIGDIALMPYLEAFRQFQQSVKRENFCCILVSWLPKPCITKEHDIKLAKESFQELCHHGISPDIIICRSEKESCYAIRQEISKYTLLQEPEIINLPILPSIYHIPVHLKNNQLSSLLCDKLSLCVSSPRPRHLITKWHELSSIYEKCTKEITIVLVGKYVKLENSYPSLRRALEHAALACECKVKIECIYAEDLELDRKLKEPTVFHNTWGKICKADGILVPSGNGPRGVEGKIAAIQWAREYRKPFLGIGLGFQCTVIEYVCNVMKLKDVCANDTPDDYFKAMKSVISSEDLSAAHKGNDRKESKTVTEYVKDISNAVVESSGDHGCEQKCMEKYGKRLSVFKTQGSVVQKLYGSPNSFEERYMESYFVDPKYMNEFESSSLKFVAQDVDNERKMNILQLSGLPYYVAVQFHPEYSSRPLKPAPTILGFVLAACGQLEDYIKGDFILDPRYANNQNAFHNDEYLNGGSLGLDTGDVGNVRSDISFISAE